MSKVFLPPSPMQGSLSPALLPQSHYSDQTEDVHHINNDNNISN